MSRQILIKNDIPKYKIQILEAIRYEHLNTKKNNKTSHNTNSFLVLGDYLKKTNLEIEQFLIDLNKKNKKFKFYLKPHPLNQFSNNILNKDYIYNLNKNIKLNNSKFKFAICSNMTSAVYDLLYLNIIPIVFLSSDSINFSPIKNLKGSIFVNNVDAFNINNFKKKAFIYK